MYLKLSCLRSLCRGIQPTEFHTFHKSLPNLCLYSPSPSCVAVTPALVGGSPQISRKSTSEKDSVGSSTILVQDGLSFQELPVVVKKTSDVAAVDVLHPTPNFTLVENLTPSTAKASLDRCQSIDELFAHLETLSADEVTPVIASYALRCIAHLQDNIDYRNYEGRLSGECSPETFARFAVLNELFGIVSKSEELPLLLEGLHASLRSLLSPDERKVTIEKFIDGCLLRISDGQASIAQIYEFATMLAAAEGNYLYVLDQLWSAIADKSPEIDASNLVSMFRILPGLKRSRGVVFRLLEKRTYASWWQLTVEDINNILAILKKINFEPAKLLIAFSKWVNLNIHTVTQNQLVHLVTNFRELDHIDQNLRRALERYMKARQSNISEPALVAGIMDYCLHFRLRSSVVLDAAASYFVTNGQELSAWHVVHIVMPFGLLNYVPHNSSEFYANLEEIVEKKFLQFRPEDLVDVFLSCTYIQRYPLNFMKRVFNPYFLDRLGFIQDKVHLQRARNSLKFLDTAMTLECDNYRGPLLGRDHSAQRLHRDGRLLRLNHQLSTMLAELAGGITKVACNKIPAKVPVHEMYNIDFVINFNDKGQPIDIRERSGIAKRIAVVINLPEHYCFESTTLMGSQSTKVRHLEKLGYDVVLLDFDEISKLLPKSNEIVRHLNRKIFERIAV